jgi:hypothetical protein
MGRDAKLTEDRLSDPPRSLRQLQRKTMLEREVEDLKIRRAFLSGCEYAKDFERIMIELSRVSHDIRARTKS